MRFKTIYDTYEEKQGIIFKEPTMTIQSEKGAACSLSHSGS